MSDAYQAFIEVLPDFSKTQRQADQQVTQIFGKAGTSGSTAFGGSFKSGVGQIFTGNFLADIAGQVARGIGELIGTGIREAVSYSLGSIDLASDLNEALNANNVTFGADIAKQLEDLGSTAPQRLALTRAAFAGITTQFSAFAKIIRGNDVVGFLDELTNRGADFASVYNLEVADALALFQSGLAGETEPLRKYGIDLSAAAVEAFAYANGIAESGVELTETQKIQARYLALLQQTDAVQGDNANTAGDLAGQQRRLAVGLEEAQTQLGQYLLPGFNDLVSYANTAILPKVGELIEKIGPGLGTALTDAAPKVGELVEKLAPLVEQFVTSTAEDGIPAFIDLMDDISTAAPEWIEAFNTIDGGVRDLDSGFRDMQNTLQENRIARNEWWASWVDDVNANTAPIDDAVNDFLGGIGGTFGDWFETTSSDITTFFFGIPEIAKGAAAGMEEAGKEVARGFARGMTIEKGAATAAATEMADEVTRGVRSHLGINSPSKVFRDIGGYVAEGMALGIGDKTSMVDTALSAMTLGGVGSSLTADITSDTAAAPKSGTNWHITTVGVDPVEVATSLRYQSERDTEAVT